MSLTGDPITDALIPVAQRLVGAVRDDDPQEVEEAFAEAILVTGGRCDPGAALAVVCAAMVPDDTSPSALLSWHRTSVEYRRLVARGVRPEISRELLGWKEGVA